MSVATQSLANVLASAEDDATAALILQLELENEKGSYVPLHQVLAETDDATASLIVQLAIEDSRTNDSTTISPFGSDFLHAKSIWTRELRRFQNRRPGHAAPQPTSAPAPVPAQSPIPEPTPVPTPPPARRFNCNGSCA